MSKPKEPDSIRLRVGNWLDTDQKKETFVVEISTRPRQWKGLMINGVAQVFDTEQGAKDKIAALKIDWNL